MQLLLLVVRSVVRGAALLILVISTSSSKGRPGRPVARSLLLVEERGAAESANDLN